MLPDAYKPIDTALRHNKDNHDKKIGNAQQLLYAGQWVYIDFPPMKASAAPQLATVSYSKLKLLETGLFRIVDILQSTVSISEDGISNTVPICCDTLPPTRISVQDLLSNGKSWHKDGLLPA